MAEDVVSELTLEAARPLSYLFRKAQALYTTVEGSSLSGRAPNPRRRRARLSERTAAVRRLVAAAARARRSCTSDSQHGGLGLCSCLRERAQTKLAKMAA